MATKLNPYWLENRIAGYTNMARLDVIEGYNPAVQALVKWLAERGVMFRVYQLGAGVKRIVAGPDVDRCPCCKRKIDG